MVPAAPATNQAAKSRAKCRPPWDWKRQHPCPVLPFPGCSCSRAPPHHHPFVRPSRASRGRGDSHTTHSPQEPQPSGLAPRPAVLRLRAGEPRFSPARFPAAPGASRKGKEGEGRRVGRRGRSSESYLDAGESGNWRHGALPLLPGWRATAAQTSKRAKRAGSGRPLQGVRGGTEARKGRDALWRLDGRVLPPAKGEKKRARGGEDDCRRRIGIVWRSIRRVYSEVRPPKGCFFFQLGVYRTAPGNPPENSSLLRGEPCGRKITGTGTHQAGSHLAPCKEPAQMIHLEEEGNAPNRVPPF